MIQFYPNLYNSLPTIFFLFMIITHVLEYFRCMPYDLKVSSSVGPFVHLSISLKFHNSFAFLGSLSILSAPALLRGGVLLPLANGFCPYPPPTHRGYFCLCLTAHRSASLKLKVSFSIWWKTVLPREKSQPNLLQFAANRDFPVFHISVSV